MNQVIPFAFDDSLVRTVLIDDKPWWVAKDICTILDIQNTSDALKNLDDDEKFALANSEGEFADIRVHEINVVNESGLYNLIFRSRKPEAMRFRKWVTSEVLPQIRKTGSYGAVTLDAQTLNKINATLAAANNRIMDLEKDRLHLWERERLHKKIEKLEALLAKKNTPLSDSEKAQIKLLRDKASAVQIARYLDRSPSSIRRFLKGIKA